MAGIRVAGTQVISLQGENAITVRRFDRNGAQRIHCISAGTALRAETIDGQEPMFGYPQLAQLLRRAGVTDNDFNLHDMHELFCRMVFNILMDNTDDHEKNHTLLVVAPTQHGRFRLSPAYDVLPTNSGQGHQEFIVGQEQWDSTLDNAMSQCELFGLSRQHAAAEVTRIIQVVDIWKEHFAAHGVTAADIDALAEHIDGDALRSQRRGFNAPTYASSAKPARRKGPFSG